jgi:putative addiction module killer protein
MCKFNKTDFFDDWLENLKDKRARGRINEHIDYVEGGNFGDCESVGEGVSEMKLHFGPGYRLYFCQRGKDIYWLLIGGTKKRQQRDVDRAKEIKRQMEREGKW